MMRRQEQLRDMFLSAHMGDVRVPHRKPADALTQDSRGGLALFENWGGDAVGLATEKRKLEEDLVCC